MTAFGEPVVMNEPGVRPSVQLSRGRVDLVGKGAYGDGNGDPFRGEKRQLAFPIEPRRRNRRVRQPVERDVVEDVVSRKALG